MEALWRREVAEEGTDRTRALGRAEIAELYAALVARTRDAQLDAEPPVL